MIGDGIRLHFENGRWYTGQVQSVRGSSVVAFFKCDKTTELVNWPVEYAAGRVKWMTRPTMAT